MSTDPRDEVLKRVEAYGRRVRLYAEDPSTEATAELLDAKAALTAYIDNRNAEIGRLTAELYDEKAVNKTQRYELQDRLKKQLAAEAELKEARKDEALVEPERGSLLTKEELLVGNLVAATLAEERAHEEDADDREKDAAADRFIRAKGAVLRALQFSLRQDGDV